MRQKKVTGETVFAIKSLSNDLLLEYHQYHLESGILNKSDNLTHPCIPLSLKSKSLPEFLIKSISCSPIVKKFRVKIAFTLCDLHKTIKVLRSKIYRRDKSILMLKRFIKQIDRSKCHFDNKNKNKNYVNMTSLVLPQRNNVRQQISYALLYFRTYVFYSLLRITVLS